MKKIFLALVFVFGSAAFVTTLADDTQDNECPLDGQAIITDCGTVHQIDKNASVEEAVRALDYWSKEDCQ